MQTPIPEPYDITDIPHIAWVPGLATWVGIVVALTLAAAVVWRRNTPRQPKGDLRIVDKLIAELKATATVTGEMTIERASRIARRIVSHMSGRNVLELTGEELRASVTEETPPRLRRIIDALASFEEIGYAPSSPQRDASARDLASRLANLIDEYRTELGAR
ncbi:MAG: hypothetical protein RL518_1002 [Pseudomonadota bacterium]|jgi:hypothetical protein